MADRLGSGRHAGDAVATLAETNRTQSSSEVGERILHRDVGNVDRRSRKPSRFLTAVVLPVRRRLAKMRPGQPAATIICADASPDPVARDEGFLFAVHWIAGDAHLRRGPRSAPASAATVRLASDEPALRSLAKSEAIGSPQPATPF